VLVVKYGRSCVVALITSVLMLAAPIAADSQGMRGGGMMNGGMMGGGMMGGYGPPGEPGPSKGSNPKWDELSSYVQSNGLACMSCHAYSARGAGPAFTDIARRFAGHPGSADELSRAISDGVSGQWSGYQPMPGGLATPRQAKELAGLILRLPPE
jgi:cytochrome c